jgi:hypothetical protein
MGYAVDLLRREGAVLHSRQEGVEGLDGAGVGKPCDARAVCEDASAVAAVVARVDAEEDEHSRLRLSGRVEENGGDGLHRAHRPGQRFGFYDQLPGFARSARSHRPPLHGFAFLAAQVVAERV